MRKKLLAIIATVAMMVTMIPSLAFAGEEATNVATYYELVQAIKDGKKNISITADISAAIWNKIGGIGGQGIELTGVTIDGNGHTLSAGSVYSASNGDSLFGSSGSNTFKNIVFDLAGTEGTHVAAITTSNNDMITNVTVKNSS